MANKHMKRCSILLVTKEMPIKTTMRYHLIAVRMAIIKKTTVNRCWRWRGENRTLLHFWWECKLVQPLWKTVQRFLKKLKREELYDPATPLLGTYLEKIVLWKDRCTPMSIAALFTITKTLEMREGWGTGGEGDDREWDGWMAWLTWWMWAWVDSGSWWWTRRPGVLWFIGS